MVLYLEYLISTGSLLIAARPRLILLLQLDGGAGLGADGVTGGMAFRSEQQSCETHEAHWLVMDSGYPDILE